MLRSGFNGINKKSSVSIGKKIFADWFSTISTAFNSALNTQDALIFTTAVPKTITLDADGLVSKWEPLNYPTASFYLTQSVNTKKPTLSTTYAQGKYNSVLLALDDTLESNGFLDVNSTIRNTFLYSKNLALGTANHFLFTQQLSGTADTDRTYPGLTIYNGANISFSYTYYDTSFKNIAGFFFVSNTFTNNNSLIRSIEEIMDPTNRTITASIYSQAKGLLGNTFSTQGLVSNTNSSMIFNSASATASQASWDARFPQTGFGKSKIIFGPTNGTGQTTYHTIIQTKGVNYTAADSLKLRNLLTKIYGRNDGN